MFRLSKDSFFTDLYYIAGPSILLGPGWARGETNIWASTPAPKDSSLLFAFGSNNGILTMDKSTYNLNWASPKPSHQDYLKDILSLKFLPENSSVLLSGGRSGALNLTDMRAPYISSTSPTGIIVHPSSITCIKALNSHRIVVAGLRSNLCQYDLRYLKRDHQVVLNFGSKVYFKNKKIWQARHNVQSTAPILKYCDYYNSSCTHLGFDVDIDSGLIAAAMEQDHTDHPLVQLFSLNGGKTLYTPSFDKAQSDQKVRQDVRCLQFVEDDNARMKSLYVGIGSDIVRYGWADEPEV